MRILLASQVDISHRSGAAIHQAAIARELASLGHTVRVLGRGRLDGLTPEPVLETLGLGSPRLARWARRLPEVPPGHLLESKLAAEVLREVRRFSPDVAYVRLSPSSSLVPAALVAAGVPYAVELNGLILEHMRLAGRGALKLAVASSSLSWVVGHAGAAVAPSTAIAEHLSQQLGAARVVLIENGADVGPRAHTPRAEARAILGLPAEAKLVTMVGTLVPSLRLDLLLEAMRALPEATLVVVGDGAQRPRLEAELAHAAANGPAPRLVVLGARPHEEAVLAARAADVCVNPHDSDLSLKGLEYAALGRRQVCFEVPGLERLRGLYAARQAVWTVGPREAPALAAALREALAAEATQGPLPEPEVLAVRGELTWSRTAERVAEVLASLARA